MSLLDVPSTAFPPVFSSSSTSQTTPTTSPTRSTGPIPITGYEPKFCIDVESEHTPINLPSRNMNVSKSTTRRSQLLRISLRLDIQKHQADRDQNVVLSLRDRQNLHQFLELKAELAVKSADISFHEINQKFESQRLQLHQANQWADQAQRDKISLYGELELRNRLTSKKIMQEIAKKLKNCEEFVAKKQIEQDKQ